MLIGTHTLLPVCCALVLDNISLAKGRGHFFPAWTIPVIGVFGALPDVCTPHLSLEARFTSWSHTAYYVGGLALVCPMVASFFPNHRARIAIACWLASFLHLFCDAIAGGIAWLYPWRGDLVIGTYFITLDQWIFWDIGFVLLTWFLVRLRPHSEARGMKA